MVHEIVAEQYKVLWDYGEELKSTNLDSTMQIEGLGPTCKRLYICLRACKEGIKTGCRPVVVLMVVS